MEAYAIDRKTLTFLKNAEYFTLRSKFDEEGKILTADCRITKDLKVKSESMTIHLPAYVTHYGVTGQREEFFRRGTCTWMIGNYAGGHVQSVLSILKVGDELSIEWAPSAYSSLLLIGAGLCGDVVYLKVRRGKQVLRFFLECTTCSENSSTRPIQPFK